MENSTNHLACYMVDSTYRKRAFMFFYISIIITAIPSNAFSLYVAWQHIRQKNELGVYLFNLALNDLSFTIGLSMWLDFLWRGVWVHGGYACLLSVNILYTNFYTSEALLCCIAIDRYLAVVHPFKYTFLRKIGTAAVVSVAIWVVVVCFNATIISWEDSYYENVFTFSLCFSISLPMSKHLVQANIVRFFLGFIVPVVLVVFSTLGICEAVESNQATKEQERKQISRLLTVILLCLLICFGPIHVIMLLQTLADDCSATWLLYLDKISVAVSTLNCLADPLLYCFITRSGKENVNRVVLFFRVKKRSKDEGVV